MNMRKNAISLLICLAVFLVPVIMIGIMVSSACDFGGCRSAKTPGSRYCEYHTRIMEKDNKSTVVYTPVRSSTGNKGNSSTGKKGNSSMGKKSSSSGNTSKGRDYDDGYEDVFMKGDYDVDKYYSSWDYADGVDDALEDEMMDW